VILLTATTETIEAVTLTTAQLDVHVSYVDINTGSSTITPGSQQVALTSAATTTILAAPGSSVQRQVKMVTVRNRDVGAAQAVALQKTISGTAYRLTADVVLAAGEALQYVDTAGFSVFDASGRTKQAQVLSGAVASVLYTAGGSAQPALLTEETGQRIIKELSMIRFGVGKLVGDPFLGG